MIAHMEGDLLDVQKTLNIDIICHPVNCQGVMGSGIAKQIRDTYPIVYDNYKQKVDAIENKGALLGSIQIVALYDNYFKNGNVERTKLSEFNSSNTELLNVEQVKEKLLELSYIREELEAWENR